MTEPTASSAPKIKQRTPQSLRSEAAFRARVAELGGTLLESSWLGAQAKHRITCANGHDCAPRAADVLKGHGICRLCGYEESAAKRKSRSAEAAFRAAVEKQGGVVVGPYRSTQKPVHVQCVNGHDSYPTPPNVIQGSAICLTCAGRNPEANAVAFAAAVEARGGTVVGQYTSTVRPVHVVCAEGHDSYPTPRLVLKGAGICRTCSGTNKGRSEPRFRQIISNLGGEVLGTYKSVNSPTLVRCPNGHECRPIPKNVLNGQGICGICARNAPGVSEAEFRRAVADMGGQVLGPFVGVSDPILVRCPQGHKGYPRPADVLRGTGICNACHGKTWDVFYTVVNDEIDVLKFGITSGDPRFRLNSHRSDGFHRVVRLHTKLPEGVARELENTVIACLRDARERPVRGREYFHVRVLPVVLDLVDHHPEIRS